MNKSYKGSIELGTFDWIDDFAKIATIKQLEEQKRNLILDVKSVENFDYKINKLNEYIKEKIKP